MQHTQITPELINDLIVNPIPTIDICIKHELTIDELLEIVRSPQFSEINDKARLIDQLRAPAIRTRMQQTLLSIAQLQPESSTMAETIRKAANAVLNLNPEPETNTEDQPDDPPAQPTGPDHDPPPDPSPDADAPPSTQTNNHQSTQATNTHASNQPLRSHAININNQLIPTGPPTHTMQHQQAA